MANVRMSRINGEVQKAVASIINQKVEHPDIKGKLITVLHVDTTPDLLQSKIFISSYGGDTDNVVKVLNSCKNFIRHELGAVLRLRTIPDLKFVKDTSYEYGQHMDSLFESIK